MSDAWEGFEATIPGEPVPKGSMRVVTNHATGKAQLVPMLSTNQKRWVRAANAAVTKQEVLHAGPVSASLTFWMTRPKSVPVKKRQYPTVAPDLDKMARNVLDVLTGRVIKDDAQVVDLFACKRYASEHIAPRTVLVLRPQGEVVS
jgi:crossover junction endodeoxyribonuclease RusA